MTIELSTAIIISVLSLGFSVYIGLKNSKRTDTKDIEERVKENTRINMKLDTILDTINEMKSERSEMKKELAEHEQKLTKVEASMHLRIIDLMELRKDLTLKRTEVRNDGFFTGRNLCCNRGYLLSCRYWSEADSGY